MELIDIKDYVKLDQKIVDWFDKIADFKSQNRPDLERGLLLYYLAKKHKVKRCLDIGTAGGYSAMSMEKAGAIVDTIDIVDERKYKNDRIIFHKGDSTEIVPKLKHKYGLTFIDGDHSYKTVKQDIRNAKNISDIIVCHDYNDENFEGSSKAIDEELAPSHVIIQDRMWYGAPYENGIDKHNRKITYGVVIYEKCTNSGR